MIKKLCEKSREKVKLLDSVLIDSIEIGVAKMIDSTGEYKKTLKQYEIYEGYSKRYITLWDYYNKFLRFLGKVMIYKVQVDSDGLITVEYGYCTKLNTCWLYLDFFSPEKVKI